MAYIASVQAYGSDGDTKEAIGKSPSLSKPQGLKIHDCGAWLRIEWSYLYVPRTTLLGFDIWISETESVPVWTRPPAVDVGTPLGNGGQIRQFFMIAMRKSDKYYVDVDNFATYSTGLQDIEMDFGRQWNGPWSTIESTLGYHIDRFTGYIPGEQHDQLNDGSGWSGAWFEMPESTGAIGVLGSSDRMFNYQVGPIATFNKGNGWLGNGIIIQFANGYALYRETFESYSIGSADSITFNDGLGWNGNGIVVDLTTV